MKLAEFAKKLRNWGYDIVGGEGFALADIDISESIILKEAHDIVGRYNRFDIFQLRVNQTRLMPVRLHESEFAQV